MRQKLSNIYRLGVKELWSLWRDPTMLVLILFLFTASVYTSASSMPETLNKAAIAVVDEDNSPLSQRIVSDTRSHRSVADRPRPGCRNLYVRAAHPFGFPAGYSRRA